jgi:hypothetical protein
MTCNPRPPDVRVLLAITNVQQSAGNFRLQGAARVARKSPPASPIPDHAQRSGELRTEDSMQQIGVSMMDATSGGPCVALWR